jgi:CRISPR-associated protein Cas2
MDSYIVAYDISDPKRLRRVARCCEDFGYRKQLSVFLVRVSSTDFVKLRSRLYDIIDLTEDQVLFIPLTEACLRRTEAIGRPTDAHDRHDVVMVL